MVKDLPKTIFLWIYQFDKNMANGASFKLWWFWWIRKNAKCPKKTSCQESSAQCGCNLFAWSGTNLFKFELFSVVPGKKNLKSFILQLRKGFEIFCITLNVAQNKLDYLWLSNIKLFPFTCGAPFLLV